MQNLGGKQSVLWEIRKQRMNGPFICFERKLNGSCFAKPNKKIKQLYFVEHDRSLV